MPTCTLVGVKSTKVQVCAAYVHTTLLQCMIQPLSNCFTLEYVQQAADVYVLHSVHVLQG